MWSNSMQSDIVSHKDSLDNLDRRGGMRQPAADLSEIARERSAIKTTCMVRNISNTGAMIEIAALEIPDRFILTNHARNVRMVCRIAWREGRLVGVTFVTPPRELATA